MESIILFPSIIPQRVTICHDILWRAAEDVSMYEMPRHVAADDEPSRHVTVYLGISRHAAASRSTCHGMSLVPMTFHGMSHDVSQKTNSNV